MFENYIKTALRNLRRNKTYAIINISGLAIGMAACLLILLVVRFESSFDNFHTRKASIYRLATENHNPDGLTYTDGVAFPVGGAVRTEFPELKGVASIFQNGGQITIGNDHGVAKKFNEDNFFYAEPAFFSMFDFGWLSGDAATSLKNPNDAVLTQATAEKFFGDWRSAIGKTIRVRNKYLFTVRGILKNMPANTDFPLSVVVPYEALRDPSLHTGFSDWVSTWGGAYTFVVLPAELGQAKFDAELRAFTARHKPVAYAKDAVVAEPLSEMHFDNRFGNYRNRVFSHTLVNALSLIGVFLLVIACVNFINLATAQAINRSREVGVRKVLGSRRYQLAIQFLNETAMITMGALLLAVVIAETVLPFLNQLLDVRMSLNFIADPSLIGLLALISLLATCLSGIYPAAVLSGFNPIAALKNKVTAKMAGGISLRRGLVLVQFVIAHTLIIGTLIVVSQMNYFRKASLGFDKAAIVNVPFPDDSASHSKMAFFRTQLLQNADIDKVSFSFSSPSSGSNWSSDFKFDHSQKATDFASNLKWADTGYFRLYNLAFVAGRPYYSSDTVREFVVNESLVSKLGFRDPHDVLGKQIDFWDGQKVGNIVGVIKDFNAYSLRKAIVPVVLSTWSGVYGTINIKIRPGAEKTALPFIESAWTTAFPDFVYEYHFLDDTIGSFYDQEAQLSMLYKIFAGIAIFISCLGLYGLVSFTTVQRTKEIGIRKVLGASARSIVYLLSREFTLLIVLAFMIAGPLAWFIMHAWLQNYSYRVPLGVPVFLAAIGGSMVIAWMTVGYRAVHAALANPVDSLRAE